VSETSAFELLCPGVQKTIYDKGWTGLHPIQTESIRAIYQSDDHLLISAQTAGGKTEAAFLPIISKIAEKSTPSVQALYVGPLKALINDQFRRMEDLCENLGIPVHRWHGDVGASEKLSVIRQPGGILLITPESLEAIFLRRGKSVPQLFSALEYIVVDELHSFLDNVRGIHLQSLFSRVCTQASATRSHWWPPYVPRPRVPRWRLSSTPHSPTASLPVRLSAKHPPTSLFFSLRYGPSPAFLSLFCLFYYYFFILLV